MKKSNKYYLLSFLIPIIIASVVLVPYIIKGKGILILWGDFYQQQIPFGMYVNKALKSGNFYFNWNNHLGNSFLASFSFYNLGSIFYLISLLFSYKIYPYLIGPILILKYGVAGLTSYAYIKTFVKNKKYALLGSILYSFCGFQITNNFFNHFHDVVALFPLLLLTLDKFVIENKKGYFPIVLAICALTNYFFFIGECVFLLIYFICNIIGKRYKITKEKFALLAFETVLGVLLSSVLFLPSIINVLNNPRAEFSWALKDMFIYDYKCIYPTIIKSFIIPPDNMFNKSMFVNMEFSSCEQYLPFIGITLAIPYIIKNKKSPLTYIILTSLIIMFIPILNSVFFGFSSQYYARWFYMPILIYIICSMKTLDENYNIKSGAIGTVILWIIFIVFTVLVMLLSTRDFKFINAGLFIFNVTISLLSFIVLIVIYKYKNKFLYIFIFSLLSIYFIFDSSIYQHSERNNSLNDDYTFEEYYTKYYLNSNDYLKFENASNFRISTSGYSNIEYILDKNATMAFISTANGNIYKFYKSLNESYIPSAEYKYKLQDGEHIAKTFLSNKYLIQWKVKLNKGENSKNVSIKIDADEVDNEFNLIDKYYKKNYENDAYTLYENKNFLSFGLLYDSFIKTKDFNNLDYEDRARAYLKGVILSDDQIKKYEDILNEVNSEELKKNSYEDYEKDVNKIKSNGEVDFKITKKGFKVKVDAKKENLMLFTIPFDKGWEAYINGKKAEIEEVSNGFMAIKVNKGTSNIEFKYHTIGAKLGIYISLISLIIYFVYLIKKTKIKKCKKRLNFENNIV